MTFRKLANLVFLPAVLLAAGCTSQMVNLTPRSAVPVTEEIYRFEVRWDSSYRGANNPQVSAYVMIEETLFPMQRVEGTTDRWEAAVPVPTDKPVVAYRYKFDYERPGYPRPITESELSPPYFLDRLAPPPVGSGRDQP
ncbi:MAG: hypothetical protein KF791_18850 [Verrucomicrobiae bacterium]|nr:hypothetical protein [Verrucomicrobiae bacterium]